MEHSLVAVGEGDVLERNRTLDLPHAHGAHRLRHGWHLFDDAGELFQRRARGLEHVVELRQVLHRLEELPQVQHERGEDT